jgi:ABC-type multidrug transport system fused ATPase/permease subunit
VTGLLRFFAQTAGGLFFLLYTSPSLTLVMLSVVPPVALGAVAYGRRVRKLSGDVQDALARESEIAQEALSGVRTVRAFAAEQVEARRYSMSAHASGSINADKTSSTGDRLSHYFSISPGGQGT